MNIAGSLLLLALVTPPDSAKDSKPPAPDKQQYYEGGRAVDTYIVITGTPDDDKVKKTIPEWINQAKTARSVARRYTALDTLLGICAGCGKDPNESIPMEKQLATTFRLFIHDKDARCRFAAVRGLMWADVDSNVAWVSKMTQDEVQAIRLTAVQALGRSTTPEAVNALARAIQSKDAILQSEAVTSLSRIGNPKAREALLSLRKKLKGPEELLEKIDAALDKIEGN